MAEKQQRAKAGAKPLEPKIAAARKIAFPEMLADPNSKLYQECYRRINNYARQTNLVSIFTCARRDTLAQGYRQAVNQTAGESFKA